MMTTKMRIHAGELIAVLMVLTAPGYAAQPPVTKAHVAELIVKVENGVDDFRKYLDQRGDNAKAAAESAPAGRRRARTATSSQKANAEAKKDDLDDALGALNRSTNRLRRKFDATDTWLETKSEVQRVMDDGKKINQVIVKGAYGSEAARLWAALRTGMNDLARVYGVTPLAV
ncbi:MAG TPA: hypothetical protein VKB50_13545 [Vicinamibacterales bacterium]|nr:hypothetical protein [Vicinamibacterales bacterium]